MRKNCARKWLHFTIDLLPVFILPIFAIWEINHNDNQPISVQVDNKESVNFNQIYGKDIDEISTKLGSVSCRFYDDVISASGTVTDLSTSNSNIMAWYPYNVVSLVGGHTYLFKCEVPNFLYLQYNYYNSNGSQSGAIVTGTASSVIFTNYTDCNLSTYLVFQTTRLQIDDYMDFELKPMLFDLTYMGMDDITISEFDNIFSDSYYSFNVGTKMLVTTGTITYDNIDIGSQMLYSIYKPVQQYFNFDNIFNFGDIRHWFELNVFNGNMGIPMTIVWNIIIYEFISDIIMLVYMVFMFFIDFATDTLERFTGWGRKGD